MMITKLVLYLAVVIVSIGVAQQNEKDLFARSYVAVDFSLQSIITKPGKATLAVWQPYLDYNKTLSISYQRALTPELESIEVDYDEIWTYVDERYLTKEEKIQKSGKLNKYNVYWKKGYFLALTQEKQFLGNPKTNEKYGTPCHQITNIYGRESFFKTWFDTPQTVQAIPEEKPVEKTFEKPVKFHSKSIALGAAERAVKSRLKSPRTAKFPFFDWKVYDRGNGLYEVNSYVDSQNSFGAMLRKYFYVKIQVFDMDDYTILEVNTWD